MVIKKTRTKTRAKTGKISKKPVSEKKTANMAIRKEAAAAREVFALPPSRLERVLHRIPPPRSDKTRDIDVEEYLVARWQDKAKQSKVMLLLEALKNAKPASAVKKAISLDNLRDFSHITFAYRHPFYTASAKSVLAKKETMDKLHANPWALKFATIIFMALVVSAAVGRTMPNLAESLVSGSDRIMLAPFFVISRDTVVYLSGGRKEAAEKEGLSIQASPPKPAPEELGDYIRRHREELDAGFSGQPRTLLIRWEDIKGRVAGAEEISGRPAPAPAKTGLLDALRGDLRIFIGLFGRLTDKTGE